MSARLRGRNSNISKGDVTLPKPRVASSSAAAAARPEPALDAMPLSSSDEDDSDDDNDSSNHNDNDEANNLTAPENDASSVLSSSQRSSNRRSRSSDDDDYFNDTAILSDSVQASSPKRAKREINTGASASARSTQKQQPQQQRSTPTAAAPLRREIFSSDARDQTFAMFARRSRQAYGSRYQYTSQPPKVKSTAPEPAKNKRTATTNNTNTTTRSAPKSARADGEGGEDKKEDEPDRTLASTKIREIMDSSFATRTPREPQGQPAASSSLDVNSDNLSVSSLSSLDSKKTPSLSSDELAEVGTTSISPAKEKKQQQQQQQNPTKCPVCQQTLDSALYEETLTVQRLPMRRQFEFCTRHTEDGASALWKERGYPKIKWKKLKKRIAQYMPRLKEIITGEKPSYYRDLVRREADLQQNKSTTKKFRLTVDSDELLNTMSTGYYGTRGSRLMTDAVISRYSALMRELAPKDSLIRDAGVAGFVQTIVVPELAVLLVKEDMKLQTDDEARRVIEESRDIGDTLNEQPNDDVEIGSDDVL